MSVDNLVTGVEKPVKSRARRASAVKNVVVAPSVQKIVILTKSDKAQLANAIKQVAVLNQKAVDAAAAVAAAVDSQKDFLVKEGFVKAEANTTELVSALAAIDLTKVAIWDTEPTKSTSRTRKAEQVTEQVAAPTNTVTSDSEAVEITETNHDSVSAIEPTPVTVPVRKRNVIRRAKRAS